MQGEIWRRSRVLVAELLGTVIEEPGGVHLPDLVEAGVRLADREGHQRWPAKTVDNTIRDLAAFGAVRVSTHGKRRVVHATVLGMAWSRRMLLPGLGDPLLKRVVAGLMEDPDGYELPESGPGGDGWVAPEVIESAVDHLEGLREDPFES